MYRKMIIEIQASDSTLIDDAIDLLEEHVAEISDETDTEITLLPVEREG
jgi:hypothetical protein